LAYRLKRRPDIATALYLRKAQNERIGVAQALRFPAFSLRGLLGGRGAYRYIAGDIQRGPCPQPKDLKFSDRINRITGRHQNPVNPVE